MRGPALILTVLASVFLLAPAALAAAPAGMPPSALLHYPGAPKPVYEDPKPPYAMSYTDEAAQKLGVQNGHLDLFSSKSVDNDPFVPVVSAGLGSDGAMLRLQWHPGL